MDIPLQTIDIWKIEGEIPPRKLLPAVSALLKEGDITVFGAYEPTPILKRSLLQLGAIQKLEIPEFYTSFEANRKEHPNGCAFELALEDNGLTKLLDLPDDILRQNDISSFYDHFIAYRPGKPLIPLITFHDAAYGGILYFSGLYSKAEAKSFADLIGIDFESVENPVLNYLHENVKQDA